MQDEMEDVMNDTVCVKGNDDDDDAVQQQQHNNDDNPLTNPLPNSPSKSIETTEPITEPTNSPSKNKSIETTATTTTKSNESPPKKSAQDLIKTLDNAVAEMTNYASHAAEDVVEARRNALVASEVAKRYRQREFVSSAFVSHGSISTSTSSGDNDDNHVGNDGNNDANGNVGNGVMSNGCDTHDDNDDNDDEPPSTTSNIINEIMSVGDGDIEDEVEEGWDDWDETIDDDIDIDNDINNDEVLESTLTPTTPTPANDTDIMEDSNESTIHEKDGQCNGTTPTTNISSTNHDPTDATDATVKDTNNENPVKQVLDEILDASMEQITNESISGATPTTTTTPTPLEVKDDQGSLVNGTTTHGYNLCDESTDNANDEVPSIEPTKSQSSHLTQEYFDTTDIQQIPSSEQPQEEENHDNHDNHDVHEPSGGNDGNSNNLPQGWVELIDTTSGLPYYYHEGDNITTWDKPVLGVTADVDDTTADVPNEIMDENQNTSLVINDGGADDGEEVKEDAEHIQNDIPGDDTTQSSLKSPNGTQEMNTNTATATSTSTTNPVNENDNNDEGNNDDEDNAKESDLPPGWIRLQDPSSGISYYFNQETNVSTWDHPLNQQPLSTSEVIQACDDDDNEEKEDAVEEKEEEENEDGHDNCDDGPKEDPTPELQNEMEITSLEQTVTTIITNDTAMNGTHTKKDQLLDNDQQHSKQEEEIATPITTSQESTKEQPPTQKEEPTKQPSSMQTNMDKLVESHAEDVLTLSLQIENIKQLLQTEQNAKEQALLLLQQEQSKSTTLQTQLDTQTTEINQTKQEYTSTIHVLEQDLTQARIRVKAAEEDALQALDLARNSDERRKETELMFQSVMNELDQSNSSSSSVTVVTATATAADVSMVNTHSKLLPVIEEGNDAEDMEQEDEEEEEVIPTAIVPINNTNDQKPPQPPQAKKGNKATSTKSRQERPALVAAGRDLLRNATSTTADVDDASSACSTLGDTSICSTGTSSSTSSWLDLTRRSAEKRRKLKDRMNRSKSREMTGRHISFDRNASASGGSGSIASSASSSGADGIIVKKVDSTGGVKSKSSVVCQKVAKLVQQSGKRLNLKGRWFRSIASSTSTNKNSASSSITQRINDSEVESMTKNYCQSVEVQISRLEEEKKDLESLCDFLELKMIKKDDKDDEKN